MRVGRSYAGRHFHHRAELCFRAAPAAGHPDAGDAPAALPRTRDALVEAGGEPAPGSAPPGPPAG